MIKKWFKQKFCIHDWEPALIMETYTNPIGVKYAKCLCTCNKCGKEDIMSVLLHGKYQNLG